MLDSFLENKKQQQHPILGLLRGPKFLLSGSNVGPRQLRAGKAEAGRCTSMSRGDDDDRCCIHGVAFIADKIYIFWGQPVRSTKQASACRCSLRRWC